jgi:hypothetical protein
MRKFIFILKRKDTEKTSTLLNERNESEEKTLSQHLGLILHEHETVWPIYFNALYTVIK